MKMILSIVAKMIIILALLSSLSACHSLIAAQITKPLSPIFSNLSEEEDDFFGKSIHYCNTKHLCVDFFLRSTSELLEERTIKLSLVSGDTKSVFNTVLNENNRAPTQARKLIVIFPGFDTDSRIYSGTLAPWLSHFSGSDVLTAPAPNQTVNFNFGLSAASLIAEYISHSHYEDVSILSFSMGAIAALDLATNLKAERHIMIAPIQDFASSLSIVGHLHYPTLSGFLALEDYRKIADNVILQSQVTPALLDVRKRLEQIDVLHKTEMHLFASNHDRISPYEYWKTLNDTAVRIKQTNELGHTELMALMDDLLRKEVLALINDELFPAELTRIE